MQCRLWFALLLAGLVAETAVAETKEALDLVPEDALGCVVINNWEKTEAKVEAIARKLKTPLPVSPSDLVTQMLGIKKGLNEKGSVVAIFFPFEGTQPNVVIGVPVTDYEEVVKALGVEKGPAKISHVQALGREVVISRRGHFLLACEKKNEEALKQVLSSKGGITKSVASLGPWFEENYVSAFCTKRGVKYLAKLSREGAEKASEQDPGAARAFKNLFEILQKVEKEIPLAAVGVRVDANDDIRLDMKAWFVEGGSLAKMGEKLERGADLLDMFPAGEFAYAWRGVYTELVADHFAEQERDLLKMLLISRSLELGAQVPEKDFQTILAGQRKLAKWIKTISIFFRADEPLLRGVYLLMEVKDSSKYLRQTEAVLRRRSKLYKRLFEADVLHQTKINVNGKPGVETQMDIATMAGKNGPQEMKVFEQYGVRGGSFYATTVALDKKRVLMQPVPSDELESSIKRLSEAPTKFTQDEAVKATQRMLPKDSQWTLYVSPKGFLDIWRIALNASPVQMRIPPFPQTPPLAAGAHIGVKGIEARVAVPCAAMIAIVDYVKNFPN